MTMNYHHRNVPSASLTDLCFCRTLKVFKEVERVHSLGLVVRLPSTKREKRYRRKSIEGLMMMMMMGDVLDHKIINNSPIYSSDSLL